MHVKIYIINVKRQKGGSLRVRVTAKCKLQLFQYSSGYVCTEYGLKWLKKTLEFYTHKTRCFFIVSNIPD
jgi:hypothetical protein